MKRMSADAALLEPFRPYLTALAKLHLDNRLRAKVDPADLVQQTMLRGYASLHQLGNREPAVVAAWLRRILARVMADTLRHFDADKRAVSLEQSLTADLDRSASGLEGWLAADHTSPSGKAVQNEELMALAEALADLPDAQREVVVLKHLQGKTLAEISEATEKCVAAVAGLLRRGLETLREKMAT